MPPGLSFPDISEFDQRGHGRGVGRKPKPARVNGNARRASKARPRTGTSVLGFVAMDSGSLWPNGIMDHEGRGQASDGATLDRAASNASP